MSYAAFQFFASRRGVEISYPAELREKSKKLIKCPNVSPLIATIVNSKLATLRELDMIYSLEDALDLCEIIAVNNYNEFKASEIKK